MQIPCGPENELHHLPFNITVNDTNHMTSQILVHYKAFPIQDAQALLKLLLMRCAPHTDYCSNKSQEKHLGGNNEDEYNFHNQKNTLLHYKGNINDVVSQGIRIFFDN